MEVRRVDLANWALWISRKFTTGVKYPFYQGLKYQSTFAPIQHICTTKICTTFAHKVTLTSLLSVHTQVHIPHLSWSTQEVREYKTHTNAIYPRRAEPEVRNNAVGWHYNTPTFEFSTGIICL